VAELTELVGSRAWASRLLCRARGDAVFAYALVAAFADAERLLDMMEGCSGAHYAALARHSSRRSPGVVVRSLRACSVIGSWCYHC